MTKGRVNLSKRLETTTDEYDVTVTRSFYRITIDGVPVGVEQESSCMFDDIRIWLSSSLEDLQSFFSNQEKSPDAD